jgi:hypothetical protein
MPEVDLPDHIELDLEEALTVLGALDRAEVMGEPGSEYHRTIRRATVLLTGKLWPDLGRWLDDEE